MRGGEEMQNWIFDLNLKLIFWKVIRNVTNSVDSIDSNFPTRPDIKDLKFSSSPIKLFYDFQAKRYPHKSSNNYSQIIPELNSKIAEFILIMELQHKIFSFLSL